jgi:hypothetical protein
VLVAARLDRITRRAHTLSLLLKDGISIRAADMPGADDLMIRVYAAMAQKERELISERTRAALAVARVRGAVLGRGDRGWRPPSLPCEAIAAFSRAERATRMAYRLALKVDARRAEGITTHQGLARALTERGMLTPRGGSLWTPTTVARVLERLGASLRSRKIRPQPSPQPVAAGSALAESRTSACGRGAPKPLSVWLAADRQFASRSAGSPMQRAVHAGLSLSFAHYARA